MRGMTIKEAVELWVNRDMTAIPLSVVEKLYKISYHNDLREITPVVKGTRVWIDEYKQYGIVLSITDAGAGNFVATVDLDDGKQYEILTDNLYGDNVINNEYFPMWGTMWTFSSSCDNDWLEEEGNLEKNG